MSTNNTLRLEDIDVKNKVGFAPKIVTSEQTGSRNIYMSVNKDAGFTRANNLSVQLCSPDAPLPVLFDLSEPKQGNPNRWALDIEVPVDTPLYAFLESMDDKAREEIYARKSECFPTMRTDNYTPEQLLDMCMYPIFRRAEGDSKAGRVKVKVIMPPSEEETARMGKSELERRLMETTKVYEANEWSPPSAENPTGKFEYTLSDPSILKGGCKVMPIVGTTGIWMAKNNCGMSFMCSSICVWRAPETTGIGVFHLGGVKPAGVKRKRPLEDEPDVECDGPYAPYDESGHNEGGS